MTCSVDGGWKHDRGVGSSLGKELFGSFPTISTHRVLSVETLSPGGPGLFPLPDFVTRSLELEKFLAHRARG